MNRAHGAPYTLYKPPPNQAEHNVQDFDVKGTRPRPPKGKRLGGKGRALGARARHWLIGWRTVLSRNHAPPRDPIRAVDDAADWRYLTFC